ncbi:MAG: ribosomal protein S18-alanine N-acetyltransferase [Fimbriimonas sp.]
MTPTLKTLRFEPITEAHLSQILAIESRTNTAPWSERSFRNELEHPRGVTLVAIMDGQVVGYGGTWLVIDEAHITTVAVAPEHQRKGIGRRLMVELLTRAKEAGMLCSSLEVRAGNEAGIKLYEQLGYAVATRRKRYYPDNQEDALVMWLHNLATWEPPTA